MRVQPAFSAMKMPVISPGLVTRRRLLVISDDARAPGIGSRRGGLGHLIKCRKCYREFLKRPNEHVFGRNFLKSREGESGKDYHD